MLSPRLPPFLLLMLMPLPDARCCRAAMRAACRASASIARMPRCCDAQAEPRAPLPSPAALPPLSLICLMLPLIIFSAAAAADYLLPFHAADYFAMIASRLRHCLIFAFAAIIIFRFSWRRHYAAATPPLFAAIADARLIFITPPPPYCRLPPRSPFTDA